MKKVWNVAIYARVSTDKKEQQESVPAQVQGLKKWLIDKSNSDKSAIYDLVEVYEDCGFSGSTFDRDSFRRMKEDIERGKINMVLTRDLSRFSRNYLKAGYYLEDYFKVKGIRFISVLDNVDTEQEYNDIIPFKNILNEMYIKDCSRRSRDGLKQRMLRGSNIASKPLYGYKTEEIYEGNTKIIRLVPAEDETTEIVREIYSLYLQGFGLGRISTYLNGKGIAPPSARINNFRRSKFGVWTNNSVKFILTHHKYAGIMVQGKSRKISYKIKKSVLTDEADWIYGGEFSGIVSKETFEEVQRIMKKRANNYRYKAEKIYSFSTVLVCNECNSSMSYRKKYQGYKCSNSQSGGGRCTAHSVKDEFLKTMIVSNLRNFINQHINKELLYQEALSIKNNDIDYDKELKSIGKELKKLDNEFQKVYEDKIKGIINQRNSETLINNIQKRQDILVNRKEEIIERMNKAKDKAVLYDEYKVKIDKILNMEEFDRTMVEELIDKIIVTEDKVTKEKKIDIFYKFRF
ncbi:recombinase family protein [Clostridiaceae bacterium UIB06]|uniref:recombinase family protein n=1 Tax=Clostridium thailandense TaxID=2794346 RepID=UPI001FDDB4D9|nr:recombinase family protein [Clostridiaceae bacterium UIB06]